MLAGQIEIQFTEADSLMNDFIEKVLNRFADDITDKVFLLIQNDPVLMKEYLHLVTAKRKSEIGLDKLNMEIGKKTKEFFGLGDNGICRKPNSTIITQYTRHKKG